MFEPGKSTCKIAVCKYLNELSLAIFTLTWIQK